MFVATVCVYSYIIPDRTGPRI